MKYIISIGILVALVFVFLLDIKCNTKGSLADKLNFGGNKVCNVDR
jgi:hypothetical protein